MGRPGIRHRLRAQRQATRRAVHRVAPRLASLLFAACALACAETGPRPLSPGASGTSGATAEWVGAGQATEAATPRGAPLTSPDWQPPPARDFTPTALIRVAADGSGDYRSLSDAVAAAPAGARVVIARGHYPGSLILEKPIILEAESSRPSLQGADGPVIIVRTQQVVLRELILRAGSAGPAVVVEHGELDVDGCVLVGGDDGLVLAQPGAGARLVDSAVTTATGAGARISGGGRLELFQTEFTRNGVGIALAGGTVQGQATRFAYNGTGLLVSGPGGCTLEGGFFWSNAEIGVHLDQGALATLSGVTVRSPGGQPGISVTRRSRGLFQNCTVSGTPMEADHHAGGMTRDHIATELRDGTDHHILTGLVTVEGQSAPIFRDCLLEKALGHGLLIQDSSPEFEETEIVGSVFYNVFMTDGAAPVFRRCTIRDAGENGLFSWLGAGGLLEQCLLAGNGTYTEDRNRWAQVILADAATTRFVDCTIRGGGGAGVVVSGFHTGGEFLRCEVSGHRGAGISVSAGGNPQVHHSAVRDNGGDGLWVTRGGTGVYQDLEFTGNGGHGAYFDQEGRATLVRCALSENARGGLLARELATPRLESCTVDRNGDHGVQVDYDGRATLVDCDVRLNEGIGVFVQAPGSAVLKNTRVVDNVGQQTLAEDGAQLSVQE
jgi:hypothetical protein